ncbi:MAG: XdhC family protein [Fidelibacterota bacterium]
MPVPKEIFSTIAELKERNDSFALATVIMVKGSSSGKVGDKAVFDKNGRRITGWVGGGCVENRIGETVVGALENDTLRIIDVNIDSDDMELGIPCGGIMTIAIEPQVKTPVLLIRGLGRVVETVVEMAHRLNFRVLVQAPEEEKERFGSADKIITEPLELDDIDEVVDYFILATHHRDDHRQTLAALDSGIPYVAVVASRKKAQLLLDFLKENGVDDEKLKRFHSPAGLNLGARSPEEIALSIMAEIVQLRNQGSGASMNL